MLQFNFFDSSTKILFSNLPFQIMRKNKFSSLKVLIKTTYLFPFVK